MRQIIIAILIFVFGPIAILVLERYMTNAPEWAWRYLSISCIIAGIIVGILSDPIYSRLKHPQASPIFSTIVVSISMAIIIGGIWWFLIIPSLKTSEDIVQIPPTEIPKIKTLHDLFLTDFDKTHIIRDYHLTKDNKIVYTIKYIIWGDFDTKTMFLSIFLPKSDHYTFEACKFLIPRYKQMLSGDIRLLMKGMIHQAPGSKAESWDELLFSGRIYIYHETYLLPSRIDELHQEYKKEKLSPQFRGRDYLIMRNSPLYND